MGIWGGWGGYLLPAIGLVAIASAVFWQPQSLVRWADGFLSSRRNNRLRFHTAFLVLLPLAISLAPAGLDIQEIFKRNALTPHETGFVLLLEVALWAFLLSQMLYLRHLDQWDVKVETLDKAVTASMRLKEVAEEQRDFLELLNRVFLKVVSKKRERLAEAKDLSDAALLVKALSPEEQIALQIQVTWEIFDHLINNGAQDRCRVRVAYFQVVDGARLKPVHTWDGTKTDCLSGFDALHPHVLNLNNNDQSCLAVAASKAGNDPWLVPDTEQANRDDKSPFRFFPEQNREQLKSMAALPISVRRVGEPADVVCIDTARRGFFDHTRKFEVEAVQENLAQRLLMESGLLKKLRRMSNSHPSAGTTSPPGSLQPISSQPET